jgi:hypothetical protein
VKRRYDTSECSRLRHFYDSTFTIPLYRFPHTMNQSVAVPMP